MCLEPHDLCVAKLIANREKDHRFVGALLEEGLVDAAIMRARLSQVRGHEAGVAVAARWLDGAAPA